MASVSTSRSAPGRDGTRTWPGVFAINWCDVTLPLGTTASAEPPSSRFASWPACTRCRRCRREDLAGAWSGGQPTDVVLESISQSPVGKEHEERFAVVAPEHAGKAR